MQENEGAKYALRVLVRILFITVVAVAAFIVGRETAPKPENFVGHYVVEAVVDGDTIKVKGQSIRYIGVDTPETKHPQKPVECFGLEATEKNTELVLGKRVYLEGDKRDRDRNNRPLRYVWLENGIFINELLINDGYGKADVNYGKLKYGDKFLRAQDEAKIRKLGLWGACEVKEKIEKPKKAKKKKTAD